MEIPGYRLGRLIGRGGMGLVYEGEQIRLGRRVAVKTLNPELVTEPSVVARFEREMKLLTELSHPSIVRVLDLGQVAGHFYYVMDYCGGGTLKDRLRVYRDKGQWPAPSWSVKLCIDLLDALSAVHALGAVHRDIKPGNVFFGEEDRVVLGDFGLALLEDGARFTADPKTLGTPLYMAPEQKIGPGCDHRADIYQIGRILHEILAREDSTKMQAWLRMGPNSPIPLAADQMPELSPRLVDAIARSVAWNPEDRQQTAAAFREELASIPVLRPSGGGGNRSALQRRSGAGLGPAAAPTGPIAVQALESTPRTGPSSGAAPSLEITPRPADRISNRGGGRTLGISLGSGTGGGKSNAPPASRSVVPALVGSALVVGLLTGLVAMRRSALPPGPDKGGPQVRTLSVRHEGPWIDLTCEPAAAVEVDGASGGTLRTPTAASHRLLLGDLPTGIVSLTMRLKGEAGTTTVSIPLRVPYRGAPVRPCLGIVLKDCFDFNTFRSNPDRYDDGFLENLASTGCSHVPLLCDPTRDDPGLAPTIRRFRKFGNNVALSLYVQRFPAAPKEMVARLNGILALLSETGQKYVHVSPGILLDTIGWSEGYVRYRDLLALVARGLKAPGVQVDLATGNLFKRGSGSLDKVLGAGVGRYISVATLTHHYVRKAAPTAAFSLVEYRDVLSRHAVEGLQFCFDVNDPKVKLDDGELLDNELMGSVLASSDMRQAAMAVEQRRWQEDDKNYTLAQEEEKMGVRMRETVRLLVSGVDAVLWDTANTRGKVVRLRNHPLGVRLLMDFAVRERGRKAVTFLDADVQRGTFGLRTGGVQGLAQDHGGHNTLILWAKDLPRRTVVLVTERPALVTPLLQAVGGPFVGQVLLPQGGKIEFPVGLSPVMVEI